jgi:flagellar basal-body rod protein FlgB
VKTRLACNFCLFLGLKAPRTTKFPEITEFLAWHIVCEVNSIHFILQNRSMSTVPRYDPLMFGEAALKLRTHRHELLGANMVNADTPGFKARDIDFPKALEQHLTGQLPRHGLGVDRTHTAHLPGQRTLQGPNVMYRVPVQPAADGNTVDPDIERGHFVKNAMFTESALSFLGSTLRTRLSAITGQPS